MMLPIGRHHDIVKTMRDFLMTNQFIDIFSQFLIFLDKENDTSNNTDTLEYWKKLMVIKYKISNKMMIQSQNLIGEIKTIIEDIQDNPIRQIHQNLLTNLKQSIMSFEEQQNETQERYKLIDDISQKI